MQKRGKGKIERAQEYLRTSSPENTKYLSELAGYPIKSSKLPDARDPRAISAVYSFIALGMKYSTEGDDNSADQSYNTANNVLKNLAPKEYLHHQESRKFPDNSGEKISALMGVLYKLTDGKYGQKEEKEEGRLWKLREGLHVTSEQREKAEAELAREDKGLVRTVATASILSLVGSIFFLSNNVTGNAIAGYNSSTANVSGIILLILAIIFGFIWLSRRKKNKVVVPSSVKKVPKKKKKRK